MNLLNGTRTPTPTTKPICGYCNQPRGGRFSCGCPQEKAAAAAAHEARMTTRYLGDDGRVVTGAHNLDTRDQDRNDERGY